MPKLILILLLFTLPLVIDNHCYYTGYIKNSILYIGAIWLAFFMYFKRPKLPDSTVVLFFSWIALSYLFNPCKSGDPLEALITYGAYLMVYLAARDYLNIETMAVCLEWVVYILTGLLIYSYYQDPKYIFTNFFSHGFLEWKATFGMGGLLGNWALLALPVMLYRRNIIVAILAMLLLWLSGSRSALIGTVCGLSVLGVHSVDRRWLKGIIIAVGIGVFGMALAKSAPKLNPEAERFSYWQSALNMSIDKPLAGYGVGSFRINYPRYRNPYINKKYGTPNVDLQHAHNIFLEISSELGLIGLGLFLFLIWRHFKLNQEWGIICGIFAVLMANLTDVSFFYCPIGAMFFIYLGLLAKNKVLDKKE